ncbi:MAG: class I SAM-dependent methyltransferase [Calditrichia bacterium]|nr:class I SAM-dependent methyltransferase [Calditrichia bacterium]
MNINDAYNRWSDNYDQMENRTRDLDFQAMQDIVERLPFKTAVEIGCGTGKNTALLAKKASTVIAMDFSEGMLAKARQKVPAPNIEFVQADIAKTWPVADDFADFITCNLVLEHIENLDFVFSEAQRTLRNNGRFFVSELHPFKQYIGGKANFNNGEKDIVLTCFTHHISEFWQAALHNNLRCIELTERFIADDKTDVPRLVNLLFLKK